MSAMSPDDVVLATLPDEVKTRMMQHGTDTFRDEANAWAWADTSHVWGYLKGEYAWRLDGSYYAVVPTTKGYIVANYRNLDRQFRPTIVAGPFPDFEAARVAYLLEVS